MPGRTAHQGGTHHDLKYPPDHCDAAYYSSEVAPLPETTAQTGPSARPHDHYCAAALRETVHMCPKHGVCTSEVFADGSKRVVLCAPRFDPQTALPANVAAMDVNPIED